MNAFLNWLEKILIGIFVLIFGILAVILVSRHYRQEAEDSDPWNRARKANNAEAFLEYLRDCATCPQAPQATRLLEELQRNRGLVSILAAAHLDERASIGLPSFSPDSRFILASGGTKPEFWDVESGQYLARGGKDFPMRGLKATALDYSPDGRRVGAGTPGSVGGTLFIWDELSGLIIGERQIEDYDIKAVKFAPDSRLLGWLAAGPVGVWDPAGGIFLRGTHEGASDLAFLAGGAGRGSQLVTASGRELWFWEPATMEVVRKTSLNTDRPLLGLSRDGLNAAYSDGVVLEVWNVQTGTQVGSLRDLSGEILTFCREPRKGWLAVGTKTGTLYLWDPAGSPLPLVKVAAHAGPVEQVACSGQGRVATVGWNSVRIWNIDRLVKTQEQAELH